MKLRYLIMSMHKMMYMHIVQSRCLNSQKKLMRSEIMQVILYSTGCPKCKVLVAKLNAKNIKYNTVSDVSIIISKGISTVPVLEVNGTIMDFKTAVEWINER